MMEEDSTQPEKSRKAGATKIAALVVGVLALGTVMSLTGRNQPKQCGCLPPSTEPDKYSIQQGAVQYIGRPRLLDLGATTCIPCKKMVPVLEELKTEYEGRLDVEFVDVWKVPGVANQYGVTSIPTQIFFDASGKELFRHQGFFGKDEILAKWDELGVDLKK
jgi:thiol-disulfide isomerase/thioredoxin